jgi:soluble lytic murein transglycosylase-like protein
MAIGATQSGNRARSQRSRQYAGPVVLASILFEAVSLPVTAEVQGQGEAVFVTGMSVDAALYPLRNPARKYRALAVHREVDEAIEWYAKRHQLSPALLHAVIKAESDFDANARSRVGALGLMQLMPSTATSLRVSDPFNPVDNISGGAKHLRYLLNRFHGNL